MRLSNDLPSRTCRLLFAALMAIAWSGYPTAGAADPAAAANPASAGAADDELGALADKLDKLFASLAAADVKGEGEPFTLDELVERVGRDPVKLFEWVRDRTHWVAYRGALRGPEGVLVDRLGNSLDRSLLLAEAMRAAGHTVRLARMELSDEQSKAAQEATRAAPVKAEDAERKAGAGDAVPAGAGGDRVIEAVSAAVQTPPEALRQKVEQRTADAKEQMEKAARRVSEQAALLQSILARRPPAEPRAAAGDGQAAAAAPQLAALKDHWWVQRQEGGRWTDFDLLAAGGKTGAAFAPPKQTILIRPAGRDGYKLPLPADLCHEVRVRVVVEQSIDGRLKENTVLDEPLRPGELLGRRVTLIHVARGWPERVQLSGPEALEKFRSTVLAQNEWVPMLVVSGRRAYKWGFDDQGAVQRRPDRPVEAGVGESIAKKGRAGGLLDDLPGGDDAAPAPRKGGGALTAEWVEYEIRSPGLPPQTIRRQVFDLLGPAARASRGAAKREQIELDDAMKMRRGLALMGKVDMTALGCQVSPEYVTRLVLRQLREASAVLPGLVRRIGTMKSTEMLLEMDKVKPPAVQGLNWAVARDAWSRTPAAFYFDRPNLVAFHQMVSLSDDGRIMACHGYDVVAHARSLRAGSVAADATGGASEFALRLEQGVLDTNAEAVLTPVDCGVVENAAELLATGGGGAEQWTVLRGPKDEGWTDVSTDPDTRARIESDLAAGYAVLVPKNPIEVEGRARPCWWRIDPATGDTLGMGYEGRGATFAEYTVSYAAFGIAGGAICLLGAGTDRNGISTKDAIVCIFAGLVSGFVGLEAAAVGAAAGGAGAAAAVTGKVGLLLAAELIGSLGAGLSQNNSIPDN